MAFLRLATTGLAAAASVSATYYNGSVIAPCDSLIYCYGEMLQAIELARPFVDSKTFVDMPAKKPLVEIQDAFDKLPKPIRNDSALSDFLTANFADANGDLVPVPADTLPTDAVFVSRVADDVVREFVEKVIAIWPDLTRVAAPVNKSSEAAEDSLIRVARPFVVAGGRFREPYYWDSYWILEGLVRTRGAFTAIARDIIDNFLDLVEQFGFIPNGARVYYLDRSQPPMLTQMVRLYLDFHPEDDELLRRALPLLIREHDFWQRNRSVEVGEYRLNRYAVANNQPRPESYREDFDTVSNGSGLDRARQAALYGDLAGAAESGWDFSSRWGARATGPDNGFPLRSLDTASVVPVCLNSILYANERSIANFSRRLGDDEAAEKWDVRAEERSRAMQALMWNETHFSYFDYNVTTDAQIVFVPADSDADAIDTEPAPPGQQVFFHAAQLYPWWTGAAPEKLRRPEAVIRAYARVARYLDLLPGGVPATNYQTGQQWDQPNVWPPLMHIMMEGLLNSVEPEETKKQKKKKDDDGEYVTEAENKDKDEDKDDAENEIKHSSPSSQVHALALKLAQRYVDSTFCTWYATGGSTSQTPRLSGLPASEKGIMFEKYADNSTNSAGGGGEYEVVEGFGWSNGVLIWAADVFASELRRPDCGAVEPVAPSSSSSSSSSVDKRMAAVYLHPVDRRRVADLRRQRV
ncbi:putative trehalase [Ophiocordyceps camponoti-leonardi (nom. inval.)]|nr:putative trehalase [Ophiocordyceps camponoti-leonardi (nom. inval.)]